MTEQEIKDLKARRTAARYKQCCTAMSRSTNIGCYNGKEHRLGCRGCSFEIPLADWMAQYEGEKK